MPVRPSLGKKHIKIIHSSVDSIFDKLLGRVLGEEFGPKEIRFKIKKPFSLPGLFQAANQSEGTKPDQDILRPVVEVAKTYLNAQRERTKAKVVNVVQSALNEAWDNQEDIDLRDVMQGQLREAFGEAKRRVRDIIATEANTAKNTGLLDSIIKVNAQQAIEDPVVGWLCVHDNDLCEECRRLHLLDDGVTPRLWYLSECGHQYHKKGDPDPKVGGLHPNDRCTLITVMPGYGFDSAGDIQYIGSGHNEIEKQRRKEAPQPEVSADLERSEADEDFEELWKSTRGGITTLNDLMDRYETNGNDAELTGAVDPDETYNVKHAPVTMNFPPTPRVIAGLKQAGRFQNRFETGKSKGDKSIRNRRGYEANLGLPEDLSPGVRPLYGAVAFRPEYWHTGGAGPKKPYGNAWAQLRPHVEDRTTYTHSDSAGVDFEHVMPPTHKLHAVDSHLAEGGRDDGYVEAQIHGGVYFPHDVEALHVLGGRGEKHMLDLAQHFGVPLYRHTETAPAGERYEHDSAGYSTRVRRVPAKYEQKLIHDPRSPEERLYHENIKDKLHDDMSSVLRRVGDDSEKADEEGDDYRSEQLRDLSDHGEQAWQHLNRHEHRPTGHEEWVTKARGLYGKDLFPYLDKKGAVKPLLQQPVAPPPAAVPAPQKPARARAKARTSTSPSPTPAAMGPGDGIPPGSETP